MINTSTINADVVKQRNRRVMLGCVALIFAAGISVGLYFVFANGGNVVDTKKTQQQIRNGEDKLILGDYEICNLEPVKFDTHIPLMIDGKDEGFFDAKDDMLVQGYLCAGTDQEVLLAVDEQGLHGSILISDNVVKITAIDEDHSTLAISEKEYPEFTESDKTEAADEKWKKYMASKRTDRREMQALEPGSIDIHIHLDIDSHMVETYGSAYAAARYGVELIAIVNRDAFVGLGFNLKVVSINARTSFLSQTSSTSAYLTALEQIPRPVNVNLLHSLSTRNLGGGIAYVGGLYTSNYCYGVSEVYGNFASWDRYVVAHELGHNFGADHTHEMSPQVDTCGTSCPSDPTGTIMSYCHLCSGGLSNVAYEWHPRVRDVMLDTYASENGYLAGRYDCQTFPTYPDVGVPFSLKGDDCLSIDATACAECSVETCSLDSVFFFTGSQIKASQDESFCWTASTECDSISLETCGDSTNQQFSFESNSLTSASCGQVMHDNGYVLFAGSSLVSSWCSPSVNPNDGPTCDEPVIPLECGGTHSGSTLNDCEGQRRFTFVAPEEAVTVSSCGSSFDTILSIEKDGDRLHYSDDDGNCNTRAELVNINNLVQGVEYTIVLEGYGSAVGNYDIALTCSDDTDPDPISTEEPTDNDCESTPITLECGAPVTGSTVNVCNGEQRFVFQATTTMKSISACGSDYDTMIFVYDSNDTPLADNDDHSGCGLQSQLDNLSLDVGAEYYVILTGWSNAVGGYTMELTCQDPPSLKPTGVPTSSPTIVPAPQVETLSPTGMPSSSPTIVPAPQVDTLSPTLDPTSEPGLDCAPAITLECGNVLSGSTVGTCNNEQRFVFTATTNLKTISACGSNYDTYLYLYDSNNAMIAEQDDSQSDHCGVRNSLLESVQLTIGAEYTVVLSGYSSAVGDYNMELVCDVQPQDECESAIIDITCGETLTGSTVNSCDGQKVFAFTATTDLKTISTCDSDFDTILYLYGPDGDLIHHNDDSNECNYQSFMDDYPVEVGAQYQIVLAGYGNAVGSYKIELTCDNVAPCDDSVQTLTCGDIVTQSTFDRCDGVQTFQFTTTTELTTISTCGSGFDTMLAVSSDNGFSASNDDFTGCGRHAKLHDMALDQGENYIVTLSGYNGRQGDYRLEVTCNNQPTWTDAGYGGCSNGNWRNLGNANSIEEAQEMVLADDICSQPGSVMFYSDSSYAWGVRCTTSEHYGDCQEQNPNWREYILTYGSNDLLAVTTYTEIPRGKCTTLAGGDPSHRWHGNTNERDCEQLCTDSSDCGGYSWSRHNACLLWTQSDLMGGGARWGGCSCHIKDGF